LGISVTELCCGQISLYLAEHIKINQPAERPLWNPEARKGGAPEGTAAARSLGTPNTSLGPPRPTWRRPNDGDRTSSTPGFRNGHEPPRVLPTNAAGADAFPRAPSNWCKVCSSESPALPRPLLGREVRAHARSRRWRRRSLSGSRPRAHASWLGGGPGPFTRRRSAFSGGPSVTRHHGVLRSFRHLQLTI